MFLHTSAAGAWSHLWLKSLCVCLPSACTLLVYHIMFFLQAIVGKWEMLHIQIAFIWIYFMKTMFKKWNNQNVLITTWPSLFSYLWFAGLVHINDCRIDPFIPVYLSGYGFIAVFWLWSKRWCGIILWSASIAIVFMWFIMGKRDKLYSFLTVQYWEILHTACIAQKSNNTKVKKINISLDKPRDF